MRFSAAPISDQWLPRCVVPALKELEPHEHVLEHACPGAVATGRSVQHGYGIRWLLGVSVSGSSVAKQEYAVLHQARGMRRA